MANLNMSLKAFTGAISKSITQVNQKLISDYQKLYSENSNDFGAWSSPMCVTSLKVNFSAKVEGKNKGKLEVSDENLCLNFDKTEKHNNFTAELVLNPTDIALDEYFSTVKEHDGAMVDCTQMSSTSSSVPQPLPENDRVSESQKFMEV